MINPSELQKEIKLPKNMSILLFCGLIRVKPKNGNIAYNFSSYTICYHSEMLINNQSAAFSWYDWDIFL